MIDPSIKWPLIIGISSGLGLIVLKIITIISDRNLKQLNRTLGPIIKHHSNNRENQ